MPVTAINITDAYAEISLGGRLVKVNYADIPGANWNVAKLGKAMAKLQELIDVRILAADIAPDEDTLGWSKAKMQAKYGERMWYDGGDLVARSVVVVALAWNGKRLSPTLRQAR